MRSRQWRQREKLRQDSSESNSTQASIREFELFREFCTTENTWVWQLLLVLWCHSSSCFVSLVQVSVLCCFDWAGQGQAHLDYLISPNCYNCMGSANRVVLLTSWKLEDEREPALTSPYRLHTFTCIVTGLLLMLVHSFYLHLEVIIWGLEGFL